MNWMNSKCSGPGAARPRAACARSATQWALTAVLPQQTLISSLNVDPSSENNKKGEKATILYKTVCKDNWDNEIIQCGSGTQCQKDAWKSLQWLWKLCTPKGEVLTEQNCWDWAHLMCRERTNPWWKGSFSPSFSQVFITWVFRDSKGWEMAIPYSQRRDGGQGRATWRARGAQIFV